MPINFCKKFQIIIGLFWHMITLCCVMAGFQQRQQNIT
jgi:hypothetical protein